MSCSVGCRPCLPPPSARVLQRAARRQREDPLPHGVDALPLLWGSFPPRCSQACTQAWGLLCSPCCKGAKQWLPADAISTGNTNGVHHEPQPQETKQAACGPCRSSKSPCALCQHPAPLFQHSALLLQHQPLFSSKTASPLAASSPAGGTVQAALPGYLPGISGVMTPLYEPKRVHLSLGPSAVLRQLHDPRWDLAPACATLPRSVPQPSADEGL